MDAPPFPLSLTDINCPYCLKELILIQEKRLDLLKGNLSIVLKLLADTGRIVIKPEKEIG